MTRPDDSSLRRFRLRLPTIPSTSPDARAALAINVPHQTYLGKVLQSGGLAEYEATTVATLLTLLEFAGDGAVLDVGANIGLMSWLAAARSDRRVVAFEPTPDLSAAIRDVASDNALEIDVEEIALGDAAGQATLFLSSYTDASNSLKSGFRPAAGTLDVSVETLDGWIDRRGIVPAIVKIDVENAEPEVLAGAEAVLAAHRPWLICEVLGEKTAARIAPLLARHGYLNHHLSDANPAPLFDAPWGDTTYSFNNWLFAPKAPEPAFWARRGEWLRALGTCTPVDTAVGAVPISGFTRSESSGESVAPVWMAATQPGRVDLEVSSPGVLRATVDVPGGEYHYVSHGRRGFDRPAEDQHRWMVHGGHRYRIELPVDVLGGDPDVALFVVQYGGDDRLAHRSALCGDDGARIDVVAEHAATSLRVAIRLKGAGEVLLGPLTVDELG